MRRRSLASSGVGHSDDDDDEEETSTSETRDTAAQRLTTALINHDSLTGTRTPRRQDNDQQPQPGARDVMSSTQQI